MIRLHVTRQTAPATVPQLLICATAAVAADGNVALAGTLAAGVLTATIAAFAAVDLVRAGDR